MFRQNLGICDRKNGVYRKVNEYFERANNNEFGEKGYFATVPKEEEIK